MSDRDNNKNISALMERIGSDARSAQELLAIAPTKMKNKALNASAHALRQTQDHIIGQNSKDISYGSKKGLTSAMLDRLSLDENRIESIAKGLEEIAELTDPIGSITDEWERPNGLQIQRWRVPLGVIGIIYESRPNVTADAGALCLKAGNAAILRGGSESFHSSGAILNALQIGLAEADLPQTAIQLVPTRDRAAVGKMLTMNEYIDVIVPRGGKSLVERVTAESRVPLFKHLEGICHTYVCADASPTMARDIVVNAKMRRTGICGATETLLIDQDALPMLTNIVDGLIETGCEVRGDSDARAVDSRISQATECDWDTEYLESIISIRTVSGLDTAIQHIAKHGSQHTDAIITTDPTLAEKFVNHVDSAIVMINASTQFADGGEFGMGAEIGISTDKLHARGPVGVEQLTSMKYVVRGTGQCRP
ncbi:MAG: glutamate-5-semialdehyde dehydrogenase [Magnetovibrio sp.]|nr:glutamate-5-semialdehyde dehydrogenase [Magnetovibrio sp.]